VNGNGDRVVNRFGNRYRPTETSTTVVLPPSISFFPVAHEAGVLPMEPWYFYLCFLEGEGFARVVGRSFVLFWQSVLEEGEKQRSHSLNQNFSQVP